MKSLQADLPKPVVQWLKALSIPITAGVLLFSQIADSPLFALLPDWPERLRHGVVKLGPVVFILLVLIFLGVWQWWSRAHQKNFRRVFVISICLATGLLVGYVWYLDATTVDFTRRVDDEFETLAVTLGTRSIPPDCSLCSEIPNIEECIAEVTLEPKRIELCWDADDIHTSVRTLQLLFLLISASLGAATASLGIVWAKAGR